MSTNILHLVSQYPSSAVYKELFNHICNDKNIKQWVFCGNRKDSIPNRFIIDNDNIIFINKKTHGKISRLLYYPRLKKVMKSVEKEINMKDISFIHAHTLIGDGGTALLMKRKYGIDYIATVRSTDIAYLEKLPYVRPMLARIIKNAKKIILVSSNTSVKIEKYLSKKIKEEFINKRIVISNGINDYWLKNISKEKKINKNKEIKFLQVSEFLPRKNIEKSILLMKELNKREYRCHLDVVGDGVDKERILKYVSDNSLDKYVTFLGTFNTVEKMQSIYKQHDIFIMPSENETFGLVYAEALSQSLPIIYTVGTGIYGFFEEGYVGYGINPNDIADAINKVISIINNYEKISSNCSKAVLKFDWNKIAEELINIYLN